jgi:hypothetical protein
MTNLKLRLLKKIALNSTDNLPIIELHWMDLFTHQCNRGGLIEWIKI